MRKNFPITELCEALGVSRSGYHNLGKREPSKRRRANEQLLHQIRIIHSDRHTRCYGSPRMTRELRALGIGCSENRVARIMRSKDLRARPRRPFRPKTTQRDHAAHPSPNLLSEAGSPSAPGAQLVSDITYIPSKKLNEQGFGWERVQSREKRRICAGSFDGGEDVFR
jgi:putative transposase